MQKMTQTSVRDSAGVLFLYQLQTWSVNPFIISCMPSYVFLISPLIVRAVDETNCLSIDGISTSYFRCGMYVLQSQVIFQILSIHPNRIFLE